MASMTIRAGAEAETSSSCFVRLTFSHGRGSSPGLAGFSEEYWYWTVVSSPTSLRIAFTAPLATALPMPFVMPSVRPSLQSLKSPILSFAEAVTRIFAGLEAPAPSMK